MPEKSGMDATLCGPALGGPSCCPQAGLAAAANVAKKSKVRGTFMSTSPHELLGLPRPRPGAGTIVYPKCGHGARNVFVERLCGGIALPFTVPLPALYWPVVIAII